MSLRKIRRAAFIRAGGKCEWCSRAVREESGSMWSAHLDHFWCRAKVKESIENCWILCAWCDHDKTTNHPSNTAWCERFRAHCIKHQFTEQLERVEARIQWNAAKGIA